MGIFICLIIIFVAIIIYYLNNGVIIYRNIDGIRYIANRNHLDQLPSIEESNLIKSIIDVVSKKWPILLHRPPSFILIRNTIDPSPNFPWPVDYGGECSYNNAVISIAYNSFYEDYKVLKMKIVHEVAHYVTMCCPHESIEFRTAEAYIKEITEDL